MKKLVVITTVFISILSFGQFTKERSPQIQKFKIVQSKFRSNHYKNRYQFYTIKHPPKQILVENKTKVTLDYGNNKKKIYYITDGEFQDVTTTYNAIDQKGAKCKVDALDMGTFYSVYIGYHDRDYNYKVKEQ